MPRVNSRVLTGLAVILFACAITCSSASGSVFALATTACTGGSVLAFCYENEAKEKRELEGQQAISEKSIGPGLLKGLIGGEVIEVKCEEVEFGNAVAPKISQSTPLTQGPTVSTALFIKKCKVTGNAVLAKKCRIPVEKETLPLTTTLTSETTLLVKPETGTAFITIPFENNGTETCPATIKGNRSVTGEQEVTIENAGTAELTKKGKSIAKSGLKLAGEPAEYEETAEISFTELTDKVYVSKVA